MTKFEILKDMVNEYLASNGSSILTLRLGKPNFLSLNEKHFTFPFLCTLYIGK